MVDKNLKRGDIVSISFDPSLGHEQRGLRPAVVVSHDLYNESANVVLFCPITSTKKNFPFDVLLDSADSNVSGYILVNHIKSFDKRERKIKRLGKVTIECMEIVKAKLAALLINI